MAVRSTHIMTIPTSPVLALLQHTLALRKINSGWPPDIEQRDSLISMTQYTFKTFRSSEDLCRRFYGNWWRQEWQLRTSMVHMQQIIPIPEVVFLPAMFYEVSPVQSVDAVLYDSDGMVVRLREGNISASRSCRFTCEDVRPALELWISSRLDNDTLQVRDKGPMHMRCGNNSRAVIKRAIDQSEPQSKDLDRLDRMVNAFDSTYRGSASFQRKPRRRGVTILPRQEGGLVDRCECFEMLEPRDDAAQDTLIEVPEDEQERASHSEEEGQTSGSDFEQYSTYEADGDGVELSAAVAFWLERFGLRSDFHGEH